MTFPFLPHRSSSDDESLDQQLNEWATGSHTDPASDEAADALEFHRWADNTRRSDPAATGPAAGTWNRVLRNTAQTNPKVRKKMSSAVLESQSAGYGRQSHETPGERAMHYSKLVATLALVLAVTIGGWFAMSQMPGGGGDGRFAAIQGTPEVAQSQTCGVEPLSVDEVMEIVKNPYRVMKSQEGVNTLDVLEVRELNSRELVEEGGVQIDEGIIENAHSIPDDESFVAASTIMNSFLECLQVGKVGHILRFFDPREVQRVVLSEYPVFRNEDQIRAGVTEFVDYPAHVFAAPYATALQEDDLVYKANPNREAAVALSYSSTEADLYDASQILLVGVRVTDSRGEVVFENDAEGRADPIGPLKTTDRIRILMAKSSYTGEWYVLATIPE